LFFGPYCCKPHQKKKNKKQTRLRAHDIPTRKILLYSLGFIVLIICLGAVGVGIYFTVRDQIKGPVTCIFLPSYGTSNATLTMGKDGTSFRYVVTSLPSNTTIGTINIEDQSKSTGYTITMSAPNGVIGSVKEPNGDVTSYVASVCQILKSCCLIL
jgi:hypothetical protein